MSITQISRITHRKGVNENLPQLAVGELGWSVDTRQLYIGNGGDSAPTVENIEILTENTNFLATFDNYTYEGSAVGYTAVTGVDALSPITRTLQSKLDDAVNVRDYGAVGDGTTDDTAAINRALTDLYTRSTSTQARRALKFPAGVYNVLASAIAVPSYATLIGDGHGASIIRRTDATGPVVQTADSLAQTGANIGGAGATAPTNISFINMGFEAALDTDVVLVDQASNVIFHNCVFSGNKSTLSTDFGTGKACVLVESTATYVSTAIRFDSCTFNNQNMAVIVDDEAKGIMITGCRFDNLYRGVVIGENGAGNFPAGVFVTNSLFDNIHSEGVYFWAGATNNGTCFNHFDDVGNSGAGVGSPVTAVVRFAAGSCVSTGDTFVRPITASVDQIVDSSGEGYTVSPQRVTHGRYSREIATQATLVDNTAAPASTGITFSDTLELAVEIEYRIERSATLRTGVLRVTHSSVSQQLSDDYDENNGATGVVFSLTNVAGVTTLAYTTTPTGTDATLTYSIKKIL